MPGEACLRKGDYLATLEVIKVTPHHPLPILSMAIRQSVGYDDVIISAMHMQEPARMSHVLKERPPAVKARNPSVPATEEAVAPLPWLI